MNKKPSFINILFPKTCVTCNTKDTVLCRTCRKKLKQSHPQCFVCKKQTHLGKTCKTCQPTTNVNHFLPALSFQENNINTIIHSFKYAFIEDLQFPLSLIMINKMIKLHLHKESFFTCIPLSKRDLNKRGFNQSELLAQNISAICDRPFIPTLSKIKQTKKQANLSKKERLDNINGCFSVNTNMNIPRNSCIIIDDVKTTGTTIEQAATELKKLHIKTIIAITLAT